MNLRKALFTALIALTSATLAPAFSVQVNFGGKSPLSTCFMSTIRVGFVGTGTISEAVVTGLCLENAADLSITVSPRNAERAAALAARFPQQVCIGKDNQDVVDRSDIVCIGVVPKLAEEVLAALNFREEQTVVGFMSTTKLETIQKHAVPATRVLRAVPMPPFAHRRGAIPMHPPDAAVSALFSRAVTTVEVGTEDELTTLMSVSGMMAPFYAQMSTAHKSLPN